MKYWDASALVPLVVAEPASKAVRSRLAEDGHIVTWAWTRTEIVSAIERRTREGLLSRPQRREVLERFAAFADRWDEVTEILAVRTRANALLARHPLRAADAGQLGAACPTPAAGRRRGATWRAALLVQEQMAEPLPFVCLDGRLAYAAELESLRVIPEPAAEAR